MQATGKLSYPSLGVLPRRVQTVDSSSPAPPQMSLSNRPQRRPSLEAWPPGRGPLQEACDLPSRPQGPTHSDSLDAAEDNLGEGVDQGLEGVAGADGAEDTAPQLQAMHELPVVHGLVCLLQGSPQVNRVPRAQALLCAMCTGPNRLCPSQPHSKDPVQPGHTPSCAWSWRCGGGWRAGGCTGRHAGRQRWCPAPAARSVSAA